MYEYKKHIIFCLKVALSFRINKYHKKNMLRNLHTNASYEGICVVLPIAGKY